MDGGPYGGGGIVDIADDFIAIRYAYQGVTEDEMLHDWSMARFRRYHALLPALRASDSLRLMEIITVPNMSEQQQRELHRSLTDRIDPTANRRVLSWDDLVRKKS